MSYEKSTLEECTVRGNKVTHEPTQASVIFPYEQPIDVTISEGLGEGNYDLQDIVRTIYEKRRLSMLAGL